jgi:folate-dependent phosphoribosylglycinamide formyltransferase PurN
MTARLVILISGNGSNLQAILDACNTGKLDARVLSVISNKADAYGLTRAKNARVEAVYFPKQENESRQEYDIDHSGVMVHLVPDEGVDNGPVLGQQEIYFQPGESLEQFEARVHEVEHKLLVDTLKNLLEQIKRSA